MRQWNIVISLLMTALFMIMAGVNEGRGQTELVTGADLSVAETDSPDPRVVVKPQYTVSLTTSLPHILQFCLDIVRRTYYIGFPGEAIYVGEIP